MTDHDQQSTLDAAHTLVASMDSLGGEMSALRRYGHRNRQLIWGLAVSLLLDAVLSVVVYFVAVQATEASNRATDATSQSAQNRQAAITSCEAANQSRAVSVELWTYVLDQYQQNPSPSHPPDPDGPAKIAQFRKYMQDAYAPRDCTPPR